MVTDPVVRDRYIRKPISTLFPQRLKKKESPTEPYWATARHDGHCRWCGDEISTGDKIAIDPKNKLTLCAVKCGQSIVGRHLSSQ